MHGMDFGKMPDSKPFYALIGANSAMAAKFRELPHGLSRLQEDVQGSIRELPSQVSRYATEIGDKATLLYTELADRGQRLVGSARTDEPPTGVESDEADPLG